ncbi:MAG: antibiotic biosynthesis monooxygenase [Cyclobacteriaceae bacterium]
MLLRIVRMEFHDEHCAQFESIFLEAKDKIEAQPGCKGVRLMTDAQDKNIYYTHSYWENEADLNNYRKSDFFGVTWKKTKVLFRAKPMAFSLLEHQ